MAQDYIEGFNNGWLERGAPVLKIGSPGRVYTVDIADLIGNIILIFITSRARGLVWLTLVTACLVMKGVMDAALQAH